MISISSSKGQSTIVEALILLVMMIVIIFAAFSFGLDVLEGQEDRVASQYYENKMLELKRDIRAVVQEGELSTRTVEIDLRNAQLVIIDSDGFTCVGNPDSNGIQIIQPTKDPIVEGGTTGFILIDPLEFNTDCPGSFPEDETGVLLLESTPASPALNTYFLWFRDLLDDKGTMDGGIDDETFEVIIEAKDGAATFGGGIFTITVKNTGVDFTFPLLTTTVEIGLT